MPLVMVAAVSMGSWGAMYASTSFDTFFGTSWFPLFTHRLLGVKGGECVDLACDVVGVVLLGFWCWSRRGP